ncbi:MAG: TetR/AcrR family transcriptional regulator [Sulfitobacter sp.]
MTRPLQKRTIETRARLLSTAQSIVETDGFEALRIEDVVRLAGVAKGTFFAHFKDKDALMDLLIGGKLDALLDQMETTTQVADAEELAALLLPFLEATTRERYIFDVVIRLSGSLAVQQIGPISHALYRLDRILAAVIANSPFRKDVSPDLLAEGTLALCTNAMALSFCALHNQQGVTERLMGYLTTWLNPK